MNSARNAALSRGDAWDAYLDTLEGLLEVLEHTLAEGGLPVWRAPEPPSVPPPDHTLGRRDTLMARMMVSAHTVEQRMDGVRSELHALPANRPRGASATAITLGAHCDVSG
ncbi:MAG TPA: hypothetical protein VFP72_18705 [Kineosporiaceae bacterium]|nr:hypothetical protein [Kineosporiaceae bacterium]